MINSRFISTTDPMSGRDVADPEHKPFLVEGDNYLTVYFESEASRQRYLNMPVEHPERDLSRTLDNPTEDYSE